MSFGKFSDSDVVRFHKALEKRFKVKFIDQGSMWARLIKLALKRLLGSKLETIAEVITGLDIELRPCFLGSRYIQLPWAIDDPSESAQRRILTAVHEVEHVVRFRKYPGNVFRWMGEYFTRDSFRAQEEAHAQATTGEVLFDVTGELKQMNLKSYYC